MSGSFSTGDSSEENILKKALIELTLKVIKINK